MRKIILIFIFLITVRADEHYQLGEGIQVGSLPLYIGGYFSLDYKYMDGTDRYRVDDVAVLGYGNYKKFSYMLELEFKELYVETHKNGVKKTTRDNKLYVERLYIDYSLNENYTFRVGKYNSPIGFWNMLPINVLRETTSSPMTRYILFPKFTTGLDASYTSYGDGELKINLMLQHNQDIDDEYNNYKIDEHYGFGISYEKNNYTVKLNSGYFHRTDNNVVRSNLYYFLLSAKYEDEKYQVLAELGSQKSKNDYTTDYAGYIQGLYRFTEQHLGILRLESYDNNVNTTSDDIAIVGYTFRPLYPIAIKSEYQFHSKSEQNQFLFSISVLF
ncbi:MAG: hypothetical protein KAT10_04895 [Sulfurimonas sp.]|nr:hypothetical protein [Sulfurimonas sp.]